MHCNACGADQSASADPGWVRFDLGGLDLTASGGETAIVPAIVMVSCAKHSTTVLAQFSRQRAQRETWLRGWLDRNVPTKVETLDG